MQSDKSASVSTWSVSDSVHSAPPRSAWGRFRHSFGPSEVYRQTRADALPGTGSNAYDLEAAAKRNSNSPLARTLKGRHLQMIAIGGSIGTGLFVNSGKVLSTGGPASLLIAFSIIGVMLYNVVHALGELAVCLPVAGSFSTYSTRFIDPAWGFAVGWNYALQWLVVFPLELVAASITLQYWHVPVNKAVWVAVFWCAIVAINVLGVSAYGEAEFGFSIVKVVAVLGFIVLGIVINCGGAPGGGYIGGAYWRSPGAFNNGFKGLCAVFVTAAFAFAGTELVGLAAAEAANPRKTIPSAIKQVFWRITIFYIVALTVVGLLVPYNSPRLLGATSHVDLAASPFVIAMQDAGLAAMPHVMNAVILVAVLSVGNSSVYGCSRTLASLADMGHAPKVLAYVDRAGRPLAGIALSAAFGLLAFVCTSSKESEVFDWLLAISGLSSVITWASICLAHVLFRRAWKVQGRALAELAFRSPLGVWGSAAGLLLNVLVLVAQLWIAVWPIGGRATPSSFLKSYLTVPTVFVCCAAYKLLRKTKFVRPANADLMSGRRELDVPALVAELAAERDALRQRPVLVRVYRFWC